jgi:hypothetical protein
MEIEKRYKVSFLGAILLAITALFLNLVLGISLLKSEITALFFSFVISAIIYAKIQKKMKIRDFLSDLLSIFLAITAWGLLIVVVVIVTLQWVGILHSPEKMEIDVSTSGVILSWLFWLTREFWNFRKEFWKFEKDFLNFKSEVNTKLNSLLFKVRKKK